MTQVPEGQLQKQHNNNNNNNILKYKDLCCETKTVFGIQVIHNKYTSPSGGSCVCIMWVFNYLLPGPQKFRSF